MANEADSELDALLSRDNLKPYILDYALEIWDGSDIPKAIADRLRTLYQCHESRILTSDFIIDLIYRVIEREFPKELNAKSISRIQCAIKQQYYGAVRFAVIKCAEESGRQNDFEYWLNPEPLASKACLKAGARSPFSHGAAIKENENHMGCSCAWALRLP